MPGVPGDSYQHAVHRGSLRIDWQPAAPDLILKVYADSWQNAAAPNPDILPATTLTKQYLVNDGNVGIEVWFPNATSQERATSTPNSVIIGNTETWNIYYPNATVTVTNTFGTRMLASLQVIFASAIGDDANGKDHDTEMWVYLRDIANGTIASYVESNATPPGPGTDFPQGYAPNTRIPRNMLVLSPGTQEVSFTGSHLDIHWKPHAAIGQPHDTWITNIYLTITWNDGSVTTTREVRTTLGNTEGDTRVNVAMPN